MALNKPYDFHFILVMAIEISDDVPVCALGCRIPILRQRYGKYNMLTYLVKITLLPCYQTIRVSDRDSRTLNGRTRHVTSPVWSRIDWPASPKIRIVGLSFVELEIDKTVHLKLRLQ